MSAFFLSIRAPSLRAAAVRLAGFRPDVAFLELFDRIGHRCPLPFRQVWKHWDCQRFSGGAFGFGKVAPPVAKPGKTLLQVEREGVVYLGSDFLVGQVFSERITPVGANDILIEHVPPPRQRHRQFQAADSLEGLLVRAGVPAPHFRPFVQAPEAHEKRRGLQGVKTTVYADDCVEILGPAAVHPDNSARLRQIPIRGRYHASVAETAEILRGIKAEASDVADRSGHIAVAGGAERLCGVLDDIQLVFSG